MDIAFHKAKVKETLLRLKRRIGKDRAMYHRLLAESVGLAKERPFGEANVCTQVMRWIDDELEKLDGASTKHL